MDSTTTTVPGVPTSGDPLFDHYTQRAVSALDRAIALAEVNPEAAQVYLTAAQQYNGIASRCMDMSIVSGGAERWLAAHTPSATG